MDLRDWSTQIQVVREMLADRGYDSIQVRRNPNAEGKSLHILTARCRREILPSLGAFIATEQRVGVHAIRDLVRRAADASIQRIMLLIPCGVTSYTAKELRGARQGIEVWRHAELAFNVTRHRDVPRHRVLSARERAELLADLKCKPSQLPRIYETDVVMRYMAVAPGNIVCVERQFDGLEKELYYRLVV